MPAVLTLAGTAIKGEIIDIMGPSKNRDNDLFSLKFEVIAEVDSERRSIYTSK